MLIPLSAKALVKKGAYELLGHFQLKTMEKSESPQEKPLHIKTRRATNPLQEIPI
jgi:hypothetical protein